MIFKIASLKRYCRDTIRITKTRFRGRRLNLYTRWFTVYILYNIIKIILYVPPVAVSRLLLRPVQRLFSTQINWIRRNVSYAVETPWFDKTCSRKYKNVKNSISNYGFCPLRKISTVNVVDGSVVILWKIIIIIPRGDIHYILYWPNRVKIMYVGISRRKQTWRKYVISRVSSICAYYKIVNNQELV